MEEQIYRKKALDRITSPEGLNDYIKAAPLSVWLLLGAIVVFLIGICCWGILGRVNTVVDGVLVVENGSAVAYVRDADCDTVQEGMPVSANGAEYTVQEVAMVPVHLQSRSSDTGYILHMLDPDETDEWVYEVVLKDADSGALPDGVYSATVIVESMHPMKFVVN